MLRTGPPHVVEVTHVCVAVVQGDEAGRSSPEAEPAGGTREHADTPVSCADTEPELEMESDTGERAGDGRDPEDPARGYSPR
jgi:hypothetical protein